jgi:hypothetical protein
MNENDDANSEPPETIGLEIPTEMCSNLFFESNEEILRIIAGNFLNRKRADFVTEYQKNRSHTNESNSVASLLFITNRNLYFVGRKVGFTDQCKSLTGILESIHLENIKSISDESGFIMKSLTFSSETNEGVTKNCGLFYPKDVTSSKYGFSFGNETNKIEFIKWTKNLVEARKKEVIIEKSKEKISYVLDFSFLKHTAEKGGLVLQTVKCPNCGGPIALPDRGAVTICNYCNSQVFAQDIYDKLKSIIE